MMPSVAQTTLTNGIGFGSKDRLSEPAISGFTAVNGRPSPPNSQRADSLNGMNGMSNDTIRVQPLSRNSSEDIQDRKIPLTHHNTWDPASTNGSEHLQRFVSPQSTNRNPSPDSPGKRKRSFSAEDRSDQSSDGNTDHIRRRTSTYVSLDQDNSPHTVPHGLPIMSEQPLQRTYPSMERESVVRDSVDRVWQTRERPEPVINTQFAETSRESRQPTEDGTNTSPNTASTNTDGATVQSSGEPSSTTEVTRAGVQVDTKKRKRQFANRTKTGCQTCRRRKKKCDEGKPECNNCARGGFICEGYTNKTAWPKPSFPKGHVPLQAKDRFHTEQTMYHTHGHGRESFADPNATQFINGERTRPIVVEDHERQATRNAWGSGWVEPTPRPPPFPEHSVPPDYTHSPNFPQHPRTGQPTDYVDRTGPGPLAQRQPPTHPYHSNGHNVNASQPVLTAHLALQHQQTLHQPQPLHAPQGPPPAHTTAPPVAAKPPKTEKDKMLAGEYYLPFSEQLVDEREQCKAALYRFNNSSNPGVGISREERARLFRAILEGPWPRHSRISDGSQPTGSLGVDVCVDAPFTCLYGYNIHVGEAVVIESNCTILDAGRITIGAYTHIGPNVSIFGNTASTNPDSRQGSRGSAIAKEVHIGERVLIGGNVTLLPGVSIGKGSTIGAGSVVTRSVPNFVVAAGNPCRVLRGIYKDDRDRR